MVIPFNVALQQAKAAFLLTPTQMADICKVSRATMYRWLAGEFVPDFKIMVSACQALGIDPEKVADSKTPKYHSEILSIDSLQSRYQEQFALDPKIGGSTAALAAVVTYNKVIELGVQSELRINSLGDLTITPTALDGAGYYLEVAILNGRLVLLVKTRSGQTLSTEVLSEASLRTAVEMIAS